MYRSFHNLKHDGNLSVYCWLKSLEKQQRDDGTLPDTIYYQVDGGPDAVCTLVLCIAELLVARGVCKRVVVTRLPVGHTHEDIDSLFAKIWKKLRRMHVITPQQYARLAKAALWKDGRPVEVEDVFCVPDYSSFVTANCADKNFQRWKMTKWAKLQFIMEEVAVSEEFPLGVRTTYRTHCRNNVVLFEDDESPNATVPLRPVDVKVHTHPRPTEERPSGGLFILQRLPTAPLRPVPFKSGSNIFLGRVMACIKKHYSNNNPQWVSDWEAWRADAPTSDDSQEYIAAHPEQWYVPFKDVLFPDQEFSDIAVPAIVRKARVDGVPTTSRKKMETTDCVQWSGNGGTKH